MAGEAKKWFIGCGIGCGVVLLIFIGLGTVGFLGIKGAIDRGENIEASFETLQAEYGRPGEFTPALDGSIPPARMETFLDIRDDLAAARKEIGDVLRTLDDREVDGQKPGNLAKIKAGLRLIPGLMEFISTRTEAMLEGGMGLGEYLYIYSLSYPVWLQKDLTDGPGFTLSDSGSDSGDGGIQINSDWSSDDSGDVEGQREEKIRRYLNRVQLKMARNQLAALQARGDEGPALADLQAEIERMEAESGRLLWETGLPEAIRLSLEPYRERLEGQYDPMVNMLESGLVEAD